jgi:hypothetical protein
MNKPWLIFSLAVVFFVGVVGHIAGAWEPRGTVNKWLLKRVLLAAINAIGLPVVLMLDLFGWQMPIALASVLVLWFPARYWLIPKWPNGA